MSDLMNDLRNSVLYEAAPDMLAALKRAVARADEGLPRYKSRTPECQADYDACVAAIAKAEGRPIKPKEEPKFNYKKYVPYAADF